MIKWVQTGMLSNKHLTLTGFLKWYNVEMTENLPPNALNERYRELKNKLEEETALSSFLQDTTDNSGYKEIVGMGISVLPVILQDLRRQPSWIVLAVYEIRSEEIPVAEAEGGFGKLDLNSMVDETLKWGEEQGYIEPASTQLN